MTEATVPTSLRHHRPFAFYWLARVASTLAFQMLAVAIGWQIYALTANPLDLGLVGLFQFLPAMLLVLVAGHIADLYDRRLVVRLAQLVGAGSVLVLAVATTWNAITKELILAAVFVLGAARTFEQPTMNTLLPATVPTALLPPAVAAASSATQTAMIVGPAAGGILYIAGPAFVYATCCALFVLASIFISLVVIDHVPPKREPLSLDVLFAGFAFIRGNRLVLGAITLDLFAVLLGGVLALLPIFARDVFQTGPWGLGLLRAAPALGAIAMGIVLARWPFRRDVGRVIHVAVAIYGVAVMVFALSNSLVLSIAVLAVLGAADMTSVVLRQTILQLETPDETRGRVNAVSSLFVIASNQLGDFRAGVAAAWLGATPAVLMGGACAVGVALAWTRLFPDLLRVESYDKRR
jgi:MFS family permease